MELTLEHSGVTVLAVDDDEDVLLLLDTVLNLAGYNVALAPDGASALRFVDTDHPEVIVLDLMMPVMDGYTVLQRLKRRVGVPPVVCLTAKVGTMDREEGLAARHRRLHHQPFASDYLVSVIDAVIARHTDSLDKPDWA